jgi:biopolymer transport protein ExbD
MLVLLIIFIITVPVMKHAVNIDLPRASSQVRRRPSLKPFASACTLTGPTTGMKRR